jgi:hypothetical protein
MTIGELMRQIESKQRVRKLEAQEKAAHDYILAELIGRSVARIYNSSNKMPSIAEAYPTLFDAEEIEEKKQEQQAELFAIRLKQFAASHNKRIEEAQRINE